MDLREGLWYKRPHKACEVAMRILVPRETQSSEARVAVTPDLVKKLKSLGPSVQVIIEEQAGAKACFPDAAYVAAGATVAAFSKKLYEEGNVILKVARPTHEGGSSLDIKNYPKGALLICISDVLSHPNDLQAYQNANLSVIAMELMPRITRAQSMDVLSSQNNLAGYQAVLTAANLYPRAFPMMMTAAGTLLPARVLVIGAGVAGLQAMATAKRLGALVTGYDVRKATKEQVESLGATFLQVEEGEDAQDKGGYAREASETYKLKQYEKLKEVIPKMDVVITTALIPGRPAPVLVTQDMVESMGPGSVVVDLAGDKGGNCALSKKGELLDVQGVKVYAPANPLEPIARDASALYGRNLFQLIDYMYDKETHRLCYDTADEIVQSILLTHQGKVVREDLLARTSPVHKLHKEPSA